MLISQISSPRPPTPGDLPKLAALGRDTFIETFGTLYSKEDLQSFLTKAYSEEVIAEELADPKLSHQVIEHQDQLIAFIKIGPVHVPAKNPAPNAMEIWQIYVRREFISHGLGKSLMDWAFTQFEAARAGEIYVSVFCENHRAIRFYQNYGFQKCGEYRFPVGDHLDLEWIMKKNDISGNK